ncbi:radial spoke head protein 1 [Pseudoscourfieldia marina]
MADDAPGEGEPLEEPTSVPVEVERGQVFGVRMNYEKLSFGALWHSDSGAELDFDFACCMFAEDGTLKDAAYFGSMSSFGGAIRHMGDDKSGFGAAEEDDEVINVYLAKVPADITTIVFVVCASPEDTNPVTLSTPDKLGISLYGYGEKIGDEHEVVIKGGIDLKKWLKEDSSQSCLMQTLALHRTLNGWNVHTLLTEHEGTTWGDIIPDMKFAIKDLPMMKMDDVEIDIFERISIARKFEDNVLDDLANNQAVGAPPADEKRRVRKVRVDIGWRLAEDETAKVDLDLGAIFYNPSGEETARVSYKSKEVPGGTLLGDDRKGSAADHGMSKGFNVNESIEIDFENVPDETKSIVFCITNYTDTGFSTLENCHARFVDITDEENEKDLCIMNIETDLEVKLPPPPAPEGEEGEASTEEAAPAPAEGEEVEEPHNPMKDSTALIVAKLYKEFKDSAYWKWRRSGYTDLSSMVGDGNLKGAMEFANTLKSADDYAKALEADAKKDDAVEAAAEATGEDTAAALAKAELDSKFQWRFRSLQIYCQGQTMEDTANDMINAGLYEGRHDAQGRRHDKRAKCTFPNGDSFFGEYYRDLRQGLGVYVCINSAIYCGYYMNSLRHGAGLMSFPNGDVYQGDFKRDKSDGKGVYYYADGTVYAGMYKEGLKHGEGVIKYPGGAILQGLWYKGQLEGPGKFDATGYTYEGTYTQDCPDTAATFRCDLNLGKPKYPSCRAFIHKDVTLSANGGAYAGAPPRPASPEPVPEGEEPPPPPAEEDLPVVPSAGKGWSGLSYTAGVAIENGAVLERPPPAFTGAHDRFLATVLVTGSAK